VLSITQIELYRLSVRLKEPFITSLGEETSADNVVVKMSTDAGITGFGECSPFMAVNGESQDTCLVVGQYLARALKGKDPLQIKACLRMMDAVIYGNTSIKSAFDMALYDIASRHAGQPLYAFIGGDPSRVLATDYTVSLDEPSRMAADAVKIKEAGYPAIKVKLGRDGKTDVRRIQAIRAAVGDDIPIRIDANQGWKIREAIETLKALAPYHIEHCEEPIARWKFMKLPRVRKESPIPIMADESCGDAHDAARLIRLGACDYFNIKLGKSGGLHNGLRIARLAERSGILLQVGAMLESRLAMTAFAHFALCSPNIVHVDLDTALMFSEDPVSGGLRYEPGGRIQVPRTPGLGAWLEPEQLDRMEKVTV